MGWPLRIRQSPRRLAMCQVLQIIQVNAPYLLGA